MLKDNEIVGYAGNILRFLEENQVYGELIDGVLVHSNWAEEIAVLRMLSIHEKQCPACNGPMVHPFVALSRRDNKTEICSDCGLREATGVYLIDQHLEASNG